MERTRISFPGLTPRLGSSGSILLALFELTLSAMVLPRPPSSPNHIRHVYKYSDPKATYNEKALYGQSTNVERPNTDDYRLLEIELRGPDIDPASLRDVVQARGVLVADGNYAAAGFPRPEVATNSLLGAAPPGRASPFGSAEDKRTLLGLHEKLYYLKSGRPKQLRAPSFDGPTASYEPRAYLPPSRSALTFSDERRGQEEERRPTKSYLPKKFRPPIERSRDEERLVKLGEARPSSYPSRDDAEELLATTESSLQVTSSELPKQIPAPPSRLPSRIVMAQTTPVQRYPPRRSDILPGYGFATEV